MAKPAQPTKTSTNITATDSSRRSPEASGIKNLTQLINDFRSEFSEYKTTTSDKLTNIESVVADMRSLNTGVDGLEQSLQFSQDQLQENIIKTQGNEATIGALEERVTEQDNTISYYKGQIEKLQDNLLKMNTDNRCCNLIFENLDNSRGETANTTLRNFLRHELEIDRAYELPINTCYRLGKPSLTNPDPPIFCRFSNGDTRSLVWSKRTKLKGKRYIIKEDLPTEVENRRRKLLPILKKAHDLKMKARFSYAEIADNTGLLIWNSDFSLICTLLKYFTYRT